MARICLCDFRLEESNPDRVNSCPVCLCVSSSEILIYDIGGIQTLVCCELTIRTILLCLRSLRFLAYRYINPRTFQAGNLFHTYWMIRGKSHSLVSEQTMVSSHNQPPDARVFPLTGARCLGTILVVYRGPVLRYFNGKVGL